MMRCNYFTLEYALREQAYIIRHSGGLPGVRDAGMVESVLLLIQHDDYYPDFLDKVTHLVFGLNKNHAFMDGNKRASVALSAFFLELNGHDSALMQYQRGMEEVVIWVAKSLIDKDTLKTIIEFLVYDTPLNVAWFIAQAKLYQPFIEPENQPITAPLLQRMVRDWLGVEMCLSEETQLALLDVLPVPGDGTDGENTE